MAAALVVLLVTICYLIEGYGICRAQEWRSICPEEECIAVNLAEQQKDVHSGETNDMGYYIKTYCMKTVLPVSVPGLRHLWYRYHVSLVPSNEKAVTIVFGNSTKEVMKLLKEDDDGSFLWSSSSKRVISSSMVGFSPYEAQCVGIKVLPDKASSLGGHKFSLKFEKRLLIHLPIAFAFGLLLFYIAPYITRNVHFYYTSGVLLGIVASFIVLLYIFSRFVPKKNLFGLGLLLGGYSTTFMFLRWIYSQGLVFVEENLSYVLCYIAISGIISFAILYRIGPAHERTMTLVQWFLQLVGIGLMYFSMQILLYGIVVVTSFIVWNSIPRCISRSLSNILLWFSSFWTVFFCLKPLRSLFQRKPKKKYLTQEEYEQQGMIETEKAINSLRSYIRRNPKSVRVDTFKGENLMRGFINGKDHVPAQQKLYHEREYGTEDGISDSDGESDDSDPPSPSSPSSGIPSPNPTPPSPPYPVVYNDVYPIPSRVNYRLPPATHDKFHTTYY